MDRVGEGNLEVGRPDQEEVGRPDLEVADRLDLVHLEEVLSSILLGCNVNN
jgi:hypothetical protein